LLKKYFFAPLILLSLFNHNLFAHDTTQSLAYKKNRPLQKTYPFYQPDLSYRIWQQFNLIREANAGDPFAQHELGLRYLTGDGVVADTTAGAMWIKKAADKDLAAARYNYGILLLNGWGVDWDPFSAFKYFQKAAQDGMAQAQYVVGLFYTDNLVIKKNWSKAYNWVKKSADKDYQPAQETLQELRDKVPSNLIDTTDTNLHADEEDIRNRNESSINSSLGLQFIDFESITDSVQEITDSMLVHDLSNTGNKNLTDTLKVLDSLKNNADEEPLRFVNQTVIPLLLKYSESGCPEALVLLGRMYEKGIHFKKNLIAASAYYIRAIRLDSPRSPKLLWDISRLPGYFENLETLVNKNDPEAMFVWYGLTTLGFDNRIAENDAINLLKKAASLHHLPSIIELGLNYYTGRYVEQNKETALKLWESASGNKNVEAKTRIAAGVVFSEIESDDYSNSIETLFDASKEGSVLAQVALGYAYENGIGIRINKGEAVKYYRLAAQRGSRFAYKELKRMYDEVRPEDAEFSIY
jgi:TPR repeat protein